MSEKPQYIHEGIEVVLTGRVAERVLRAGKKDIKHEIRPADVEEGSYTRWVQMKELYIITQE